MKTIDIDKYEINGLVSINIAYSPNIVKLVKYDNKLLYLDILDIKAI